MPKRKPTDQYRLRFKYEIESKKRKDWKSVRKSVEKNFPDDPQPNQYPPWMLNHLNCGKRGTPQCGYCRLIKRLEKTMAQW